MIDIRMMANHDIVAIFGQKQFPSYEPILSFEMGMYVLECVPDCCMVCNNNDLAVIKIMLEFAECLDKACCFQFSSDIILFCEKGLDRGGYDE